MEIFIYALLPVIFMFQEFEEILFLKIWLDKDNKSPEAGSKIYSQYSGFTTSGFVFAIAEKFLLINILTYAAMMLQKEYMWFAVFMGFSAHLVIYIFQWIINKKYLPVITTGILVLPYCIFGFIYFINNNVINTFWIITSSIIGIAAAMLNLKFINYIGYKFSKYKKNNLSIMKKMIVLTLGFFFITIMSCGTKNVRGENLPNEGFIIRNNVEILEEADRSSAVVSSPDLHDRVKILDRIKTPHPHTSDYMPRWDRWYKIRFNDIEGYIITSCADTQKYIFLALIIMDVLAKQK
jgi:uncharacterized membrane protein